MQGEKPVHIDVVCAIIERGDRVLAAQRGAAMRMPLQWEFPGGKVERGEEAEAALARELLEEMGVAVAVKRRLPSVTHRYPDFVVTLHPFVCSIRSEEVLPSEHHAVLWLEPDQLPDLDWVEADHAVVDAYRKSLRG